jgi:hypothetical protein
MRTPCGRSFAALALQLTTRISPGRWDGRALEKSDRNLMRTQCYLESDERRSGQQGAFSAQDLLLPDGALGIGPIYPQASLPLL